jgi:hypothetical protein
LKNQESILKKIKEYGLKNTDKLIERNRINYLNNKELIKAQTNKYYNENKEKKKEYYEKNKEIINCECGQTLTKNTIKRHMKTKKHFDAMNKLQV